MRLSILFLPLILLISSVSHATNWYPSSDITEKDSIQYEPLQCPTIGKDYSIMIGQLQSLQDSLKRDANCGQLSKKLQEIGYLAGERRQKYLDTIEKIKAGEQIKDKDMVANLINYAEDITVAAGSLGVMLSEGDQCFGKQDPTSSLMAISSFVNEATTLLSTVAGPWGPALAIGGKVTAGFLSGIGKFIASRPGFKFYDKKDWQSYVEALC
ncbi:MAG: hypothetical protein KDD34_09185, partial [Bdellovibrionales bacterium]|nr:hypothetical protein [Bdellovibrionales bacterium]